MKLSTIEETLSLKYWQEAEEKADEALAAAQRTIEEYGGRFGGTGQHIDGLWTFGSCMHGGF
ncbi:hypothetical protein B0A55_04745 [Friedmanniomyces simplex]|uniref:Uncharacterized protein n=1 Tax=Friedmanniomyces simplex TaxID=329884 RepID=A0A4U0XRQ2_9PEZI|nr:hypothetical protein B0A55_04745 [Friedmanniomyces simplex]